MKLEPTLDPRVEVTAAWLYKWMMAERGHPDKSWADCPDHYKMPFKDGWRSKAEELLWAVESASSATGEGE